MSTSLVTDEPEDRQVENVMLPPAGLVWRRHRNKSADLGHKLSTVSAAREYHFKAMVTKPQSRGTKCITAAFRDFNSHCVREMTLSLHSH